jgi:outer membrane lipoprotein-sorting protein
MRIWGVGLVVGAAIVLGATAQDGLPAPLVSHFDRLESAKTLRVEFSILEPGKPPVPVTLAMEKPNHIRLTEGDLTVVSDGTTLTTLSAKDATYSQAPLTEEALNQIAGRTSMSLYRGFLQRAARQEVLSARSGIRRRVSGVDVDEVEISLKGGSTATLFIDTKLGVARGANLKVNPKTLVLLAKTLELDTKVPENTFTFRAPAGAKKVEPAPAAPTFAEVQKVLNGSCMPCHSARGQRGGVNLSNYAGVKVIVVPGNPGESLLIKALRGKGAAKMPLNAAPLPEETIGKIEAWISAGAKE